MSRWLADVARELGVPALVPANEVGFDGSQRPCRRYRPSPDRVSKALLRAAPVGVPCSQHPGRTVSLTAKQFHYACGNMLTEEEPDALHVGLFWFPSVGSAGVGISAWHRAPIERAPVWQSIHLASWPANRLA